MHLDLTQGDIKSHIKTVAVPASVGFFFHTMYNVTDTYFAGMISTEALGALTLSFSIFFMMIAIAEGMSEAITALVGNALGEKNSAYAVHIANNALVFALILSVVLTLLGMASAPFLMKILGASGSYLGTSLGYINIIIYGTVFFVFTFFFNALLNSMGDTKSFRNILIVTAFLNIFMDYWFVVGGWGIAPMGVEGIAMATVMTEMIAMGYLGYRLSRTVLYRHEEAFRLDGSLMRTFLMQGYPPSLNMVLVATGIFIITYFAAPYGAEVVAAFGIGMRIEQIILMPMIGLNVAVLAIVSQNNGAKRYARIHETLKDAIRYGVTISLIGMAALLLVPEHLMDWFSNDPKVIYEGGRYLRVEAFVLFPFAVIFIYLPMLQGIEKPEFIAYLSIARQIIFPLAVLWGLSIMDVGVIWIWIAIALIVILSAVVTWVYAQRKLDRVAESF